MFSNEASVRTSALKIRRMNCAGLALVVFSFLLPFLPVSPHGRLPMEPSLALVGVTTAWVVTQLLGWLVVRGQGEIAKARVRLLVGVALLCVVGSNMAQEVPQVEQGQPHVVEGVARAAETKDEAFTRQARAMDEKYKREFEALGKRFRDADISHALTPEGVTTASGLVSGRALVTKYRALLEERTKLLAQRHTDSAKLLKQKAPSEDAKKEALFVLENGRARLEKLDSDLGYAQEAMADAMWDILAWFQGQLGHVGVNNGKVVYFLAQQKREVDPLFERLRYTEGQQRAVFEHAAREQALVDAIDATPASAASAASAPLRKTKVAKRK